MGKVSKLVVVGVVLLAAVAAGTASAQKSRSQASDTLTFGLAAGISSLDPNTIDSAAQAVLQPLLFNGLTRWGQDMSVQPDLATSWKASPDKKTWWFTIRKGVRFHSGKAFTAADAAKNILRVLDPKTGSQEQNKVAEIRSVRALNPTLLRIILNRPNSILPTALVEIKMSNVDDIDNVNKNGDGTGPFTLKSFVPASSITLVRNDAYWGTKAKLKTINITRLPDATSAFTAFQSGKIDALWQVPPLSWNLVIGNKNTKLLKPKLISGANIWEVDNTSPPFNNVLARRALSYAMDRVTMAKAAYAGQAQPALNNSLLNPANPVYTKALPNYAFNLDKAKALFTQAGVKEGDTFQFWALAGRRDDWAVMAQVLQSDLKKIGINLDIVRNDFGTWLGKFFPPGKKYPGVIIANYFSLPPVAAYAFSQVQPGTCECNWQNPTFDALLRTVVGLQGAADQKESYDDLQKIFANQLPVLVPNYATNLTAVQAKVQGVWIESQGNVHLEGASISG